MRWYRERTTTTSFAEQKNAFSEAGLWLEHPTRAAEIMLDVDGDDVELGAGAIAELLELKLGPVNVEWWFSSDENLTCKYDYEPLGMEIQTYYLDGLTALQCSILEQLLTKFVRERRVETRALIVDRSGDTAEFDWDAVILYERPNSFPLPESMILPAPIAEKLSAASVEYTITSIPPNLVLFQR